MGNVEDLKVRKDAIRLAKDIYFLTLNNTKLSKDFWLKEQIQRSAVSVASNISEWCYRWTDKEFIRFLYIARGSCSELKTQIIIAREIGYIENEIYNKLCLDINVINRMINGLISKLSS